MNMVYDEPGGDQVPTLHWERQLINYECEVWQYSCQCGVSLRALQLVVWNNESQSVVGSKLPSGLINVTF